MYSVPFEYERVTTLPEALQALQSTPNSQILAGGHSLIPATKLRLARPEKLIDISRLEELKEITPSNGSIRIGALATHHQIARSSKVKIVAQALSEACEKVGDPAVRNWGTIGGNLAHADPASDPPPALTVAKAVIELTSYKKVRYVPINDFFVDLFLTQLLPGEIVTAVTLTEPESRSGSAYLKHAHPASGYAVCGAAAAVTIDADDQCVSAILSISGVSVVPQLVNLNSLEGQVLSDLIVSNALSNLTITKPLGDIYASSKYRKHLARALSSRALLLAAKRANGL